MNDNPTTQPFTEAGVATVEDGHVILDGPDGVAITLTAHAAVATGRSLVEAGEKALREAGTSEENPGA
jgi:hypothetical protein